MIYSFRYLILLVILFPIQIDLYALSGISKTSEVFEGIIKFQIKSSAEDVNGGMMPAFTEYHIKENDIIIQMFGAENIKLARILIKGDQNSFYMIDDEAKTAMKIRVNNGDEENRIGNVPEEFREEYEKALRETDSNPDSEMINLIETNQTLDIQGYNCTKYIVTTEAGEAFVESEVWLTNKIYVEIPEVLKDKNNPLLLFMNEKGFPLRFKGKSKTGGQSFYFEMVAVEVTRKKLATGDFEIPEDYHISDMTSFLDRE